MQLILASASPRRSEILQKENYKFTVIESDYIEQDFSLDPISTAKTFALGKAKSVFEKLANDDIVVLGADTVVCLNGQILGKPKDEAQARQMLLSLSGKIHSVVTGFCLYSKKQVIVDYDSSLVEFNVLDDVILKSYLDSGLYKGKAGAYGIQDKDFNLVKCCKGSINNVVGLPIEKIRPLLDRLLKK